MAQQYIETFSKELKEFDDLIKTKVDLPQNIGIKIEVLHSLEYFFIIKVLFF